MPAVQLPSQVISELHITANRASHSTIFPKTPSSTQHFSAFYFFGGGMGVRSYFAS